MFGSLTPWKKRNPERTDVSRAHAHPLTDLRQQFVQLWERMVSDFGSLGRLDEPGWLSPRIDLADEEDRYVLRAEVPGFEPEDFDVKLSGNVLTIRAEYREDPRQGNGGFHRYGSFYESFTLPRGVQEEQIDAQYHSGVLEVRLPKAADASARRIEVKSS